MHISESSLKKVPLKSYTRAPEISAGSILFESTSSRTPGLLITEMVKAEASRLVQQADDVVIQGLPKMKLYVSWPGYTSHSITAPIDCTKITRADLATAVSCHLVNFVQKMNSLPVQFNSSEWRIGRGGVSLNNIVLTALYNTGGDYWQPELELLDREA
ncbi:hypothetical protein EW145_g1268 [Phellinidium pouzarii]|uniref:Uncharacterized protein n=1 Tax=Phellinidium pouzarii TaxID=167371 RepID=A0A4V3XDP2_9AGAM|nr:hypothetical protein EW145_g1268 [Phellinidium pouzarii]